MSNTPWVTDKWFTSPWNFAPEAMTGFDFAKKVKFHDVTLRDGEQQAGLVFNKDQKVALAEKMAEMGMHRIEAGMPAVSPQDRAAIIEIAKRFENGGPEIFAFARCMKADVLKAVDCGVKGIVVEIPASEHLVKYAYKWEYEKAIELAVKEFGRLDILVNNAGISERTPMLNYTEELYDQVMDLNVRGVFNTSRVAAEFMDRQGGGVILNTSSMVSIYGQPSGMAYPTSKFAVNGMTVSLARELGPKGIRVNAVAPGITETDMMKAVPKEIIDPMIRQIPLRRLGQPVDIANAFVFLASEEASYITGVILSVDGMARS